MTEHGSHAPHDAAHAPAAPGARPYFSAAEWEYFQKEDIAATKVIIGLMTSIFSIGLVMYLAICLLIAS